MSMANEKAIGAARQRRETKAKTKARRKPRKLRQLAIPPVSCAGRHCIVRMSAKKSRDPVFVFLAQKRTSHVENAPARLYEAGRLFQSLALLRDPDRERARPHPPFRIRIAPPGARAGTGRIDKNEITAPFESRKHVSVPARRMQLDVADPGAFESREAPHEPCPIAVARMDLALVLHRCGERQGFAARARAKIEHLLAWPCQGKDCGKLRAFILNFDETLDIGGLGGKRRAAPVGRQRQAQAERG